MVRTSSFLSFLAIPLLNKQFCPFFLLKLQTIFQTIFFLKKNNMSTKFFSKLSQNYIELLEDDEYYDTTIEVGEGHNVKIFRAHMNILCYRSPYLRRTLASNKKTTMVFWLI